MESTPLGSEEHDDDQDSSKSRKKDAKSLGSFLVEPKSDEQQPKVVHEGLLGIVNHDEELPEDSSETDVEEFEDDTTSIETLSEEEQLVIEQQIIANKLHEVPESSDSAEVTEAIDGFHHKVLDENKTSQVAFTETMQSVEESLPESEAPNTVDKAEQAELNQAYTEAEHPQDFSDEPILIQRSNNLPPNVQVAGPEKPIENQNQHTTLEVQNNAAADMFVGGVVGYLIGRRRGRIKAEKQLIPIQKKLEKQVKALQSDIANKENAIRLAVTERQSQAPHVAELTQASSISQAIESNAVPAVEQIQRVNNARPENRPAIPAVEIAPELTADVHVETMRRQDLLELAEKVHVEGTTLRRVFETHLISEKGLRRVLAEHLRGGDVIKALNMEMTEHQIDFERDPILRDMPQAASVATQPTLDELLQNANIPTNYEQVHRQATLQAQSEYHEHKARSTGKLKRTADAAMIGIILVLIALIVTIVIQRM